MSLTRADLESSRLHEMVLQSGAQMQPLSESQLKDSIRDTLNLNSHNPHKDVWLFAYGSLIWNPIFKFVERRVGNIYGWHRRFCLQVPLGRGTPENPALLLGLDYGGSCSGVAYRVAARDVESELLLLWKREMIVDSYIPRWVKVFDGKEEVLAITFVINHQQPSYVDKMSFENTVNIIAKAKGEIGSNAEYLTQTVKALENVGIKDKKLLRLHKYVLQQQNN